MAAGGSKVLVQESGLTDFFADEDAQVRAATTAWLRANTPWDVVSADQVETVRVRALGGRNLKTGATCGGPRHSHEGYERAFGSYDAAHFGVKCGVTCALQLSVSRNPRGATRSPLSSEGAVEFYFAAAVSAPVTIETVLRAIPNLRRETAERDEGPAELLADFETSRLPRPRSSVKLSVWNGLAPDAFASIQSEIDACYRPGGGQEMFLLSVREGGHVDRCEGRPWNAVPSRGCVCAALKKVQLPASVAGTRAAFDALHQDKDGAITPPRTPPCTDD